MFKKFKKRRDLRKRKREAEAAGCYWHPCKICGEFYGGNKVAMHSLAINPWISWLVCPNCDDHPNIEMAKWVYHNVDIPCNWAFVTFYTTHDGTLCVFRKSHNPLFI